MTLPLTRHIPPHTKRPAPTTRLGRARGFIMRIRRFKGVHRSRHMALAVGAMTAAALVTFGMRSERLATPIASATKIAAAIVGSGETHLRFDIVTGAAVVTNARLSLADGSQLYVGEVRFSTGYGLTSAALAAENIALKNVSVEAADFTLRAPVVEITGSSLTQKDFTSLLDGSATKPLVDLLAGFSAAAIAIPEAVAERKLQGARQVYTFRKLTLRDIAAGKAATLNADDGIIVGPSPSEGKFGTVSGKGIDLAQLARVLAAAPATPDREPKALAQSLTADKIDLKTSSGATSVGQLALTDAKIQLGASAARFLPLLGTVTASDITVDTVRAAAPTEKVHWTAKSLALTADAPRESAPTKFALKLDSLSVPVPANSSDATMKNLAELGYSAVVLSISGDANWNPQSNDIDVKQLSIAGADFGSITLNATLGKITKDVFSGDKTVSQAAYKNATAKMLGITVENRGLYEHIVTREAKKRGKSLDDTRKELSLASSLTFTSMTSSTPAGNIIATAIGKFVAKPGKLTIAVKSKDAGGIPIASLSDAAARKALNDKIDITATAE